jgi:glycerophosphoryl diester phosphodiesterase
MLTDFDHEHGPSMIRRAQLWGLGLLLVLAAGWAAGCGGSAATHQTAASTPVEHYRSFEDAGALAQYLRADSGAGPLVSAHRGGPMPGYPENALATFHHSLRYGPVVIECDVRATADSVLVLLHDETLDRTTTGDGPVDEKTVAELREFQLVDNGGHVTPFRIPTLAEALAWAEGRAVLMLDVKESVPYARVVDAMRRAEAFNRAVVITYSVDDAEAVQERSPKVVVSAPAESPDEARDLLRSLDRTRIVAFTGVGTLHDEVLGMLTDAGVRATVGTFGEWDAQARRDGPGVYRRLIEKGAGILATDLVPVATRASRPAVPAGSSD